MNIESLISQMSAEDQANFTKAISTVAAAFSARNGGIEIDPTAIAATPQIRDHVLSGGEYPLDIEASLEALKKKPTVQTQLIAAEIETARISKINSDIKDMTRPQRMEYAREHGLDRPRRDSVTSMTANEHQAVLAQLSPQNRINYARRHGLT